MRGTRWSALFVGAIGSLVAGTALAVTTTVNGHGAFSPSNSAQSSCFTEYYGGIRKCAGGTEGAIYFNLPLSYQSGYFTVYATGLRDGSAVSCKLEVLTKEGNTYSSTTPVSVSPNVKTYLGQSYIPSDGTLRVVCLDVAQYSGLASISYSY